MKGAGCNLLGRDWFTPLHIQVHGINQMEHPTDEIKEVISRHPDMFREDIDGYTGPLIQLEDASPTFCKTRPVPLALQGPMEDELDHLQHQGILSLIQHCNWATPVVLVRKNYGALPGVVTTGARLTQRRRRPPTFCQLQQRCSRICTAELSTRRCTGLGGLNVKRECFEGT